MLPFSLVIVLCHIQCNLCVLGGVVHIPVNKNYLMRVLIMITAGNNYGCLSAFCIYQITANIATQLRTLICREKYVVM